MILVPVAQLPKMSAQAFRNGLLCRVNQCCGGDEGVQTAAVSTPAERSVIFHAYVPEFARKPTGSRVQLTVHEQGGSHRGADHQIDPVFCLAREAQSPFGKSHSSRSVLNLGSEPEVVRKDALHRDIHPLRNLRPVKRGPAAAVQNPGDPYADSQQFFPLDVCSLEAPLDKFDEMRHSYAGTDVDAARRL